LAEPASLLFEPFVDLWWEIDDDCAHGIVVPRVLWAMKKSVPYVCERRRHSLISY
jgi:hypothetical protein